MATTFSYSAQAHWTHHKRGILEVADIPRTINFGAPPEFGGEPGLWTPEHMLIGAVASCFVSTFRAMAEFSKLPFHGMDVKVEGVIEKQEGGFRFTSIVVRPVVLVEKAQDRERAQRLVEKAENACLISRSLACKVALEPEINIEEMVAAK